MDSNASQFIRFALECEALKFGSFDRQEKGKGETSSVEEMGKEFRLPVISVANVVQLAEMVAGDAGYSGFISGLRWYQGRYGVVSDMK